MEKMVEVLKRNHFSMDEGDAKFSELLVEMSLKQNMFYIYNNNSITFNIKNFGTVFMFQIYERGSTSIIYEVEKPHLRADELAELLDREFPIK